MIFVLKCPVRMTIALRYILTNPSTSQSSFLPTEETKTKTLEKGEEKDLPREEDERFMESQKELKVPVKELEILKGRELEIMETERSPENKKPLNKSLSASNVGNGGGKLTGQKKPSNLPTKTKQSSLPPASRLANGRKDNVPALKLTVKYNKITSILSLVVHKGRVSTG